MQVEDRLAAYEARLARMEKLMRESLGIEDRVKKDKHANKRSNRHHRERSRASSRSSDDNKERSLSPSPQRIHGRQNCAEISARSWRGDEYFKVPELLPTFKSENEDPEAFVDDFNSVLECIEETGETKTVLWFKNRISVPSSNWDANLNPRKDSLRTYQRVFLKYFWSPSAQRLAIENFENARLNLKSEIPVS